MLQQQQSHTDSRKTSGANTPSKDGADTPPYRDQMQNNSYILNLAGKRLSSLQQQRGLHLMPSQQMNEPQPQAEEDLFRSSEQFTGSSTHAPARSQP